MFNIILKKLYFITQNIILFFLRKIGVLYLIIIIICTYIIIIFPLGWEWKWTQVNQYYSYINLVGEYNLVDHRDIFYLTINIKYIYIFQDLKVIFNYLYNFTFIKSNYYFFYLDYLIIFIAIIVALILASILVLLSIFSSNNLKILDKEKLSAFECGFSPFNSSRQIFYINFYKISILYILFDVELIYLLPWCKTMLSNLYFLYSNSLSYFLPWTDSLFMMHQIRYMKYILFESFKHSFVLNKSYYLILYFFISIILIGLLYEIKTNTFNFDINNHNNTDKN